MEIDNKKIRPADMWFFMLLIMIFTVIMPAKNTKNTI